MFWCVIFSLNTHTLSIILKKTPSYSPLIKTGSYVLQKLDVFDDEVPYMEDMNLKILKEELATQLHSYDVNQFSKDILSCCTLDESLDEENIDSQFDSILSAKNDWESCVDSLEHQALLILDHELNIIRANRTIEMWGWGDVIKVNGTHFLNLIKPVIDDESIDEWYKEWCQLDIQSNTEWESNNYTTGKKYRFSFYPNRDIDSFHHDDSCYAVMLICDVTEKKSINHIQRTKNRRKSDAEEKNEQNVLYIESEKRLHQLASQLINSQETERKRVSSELHDGIGQILSALKYQVESVVSESKNTSKQRKNDVVISNVLENIKSALNDLRRISVDLRPSAIDDLGLQMAMRWFSEEYKKVYTKVNVEFHLNFYESKISYENKNVIYRIVQEAMNNIAKHAYAKNIYLQLTDSDSGLLLRITDDGCGFDIDKVKSKSKSGLGLKNMEERAINSGAKFTMSSNTSLGTTIQMFWENN